MQYAKHFILHGKHLTSGLWNFLDRHRRQYLNQKPDSLLLFKKKQYKIVVATIVPICNIWIVHA